MKQVFFFILIVISIQSNAQVWVNSNAIWSYDYSGVAEGGTFRWKYINDSVIQGRPVQVLHCEQHYFVYDQFGQLHGNLIDNGNSYTSVSGDTVFYLNNNQFYVLYNFGANVGDQWIIGKNVNAEFCDSISSVQVTDTGTIMINGQLKRTITLQTLTSGEIGMDGLAIEGIGLVTGNNFGLFPGGRDCPGSGIITDWYILDFRCFTDDTLGLYHPGSVDCNHLTVSIIENEMELFSIFPNPSTGKIKIDNLSSERTLMITDFTGKTVFNKEISPDQNTIDISDLTSGVYLLRIGGKRMKLLKI